MGHIFLIILKEADPQSSLSWPKSNQNKMAGFGIQKDGLDSVIVKMDRAPAVYNAGDIFAGKVIVVCLETTPVKGIKVS